VLATAEAGIAVGQRGRSSMHAGLSAASERLGFEQKPASKLVMAAGGSAKYGTQKAMRGAIRAALLGEH